MPTLRLLPLAIALALGLTGCAVGPVFQKPTAQAPDDWTTWRSGEASLRIPVEAKQAMPAQWWLAFHDSVLDQLQQRAIERSPDLRTAALHFAQARSQRSTVAAQQGPEVNASGSVTRQRLSEVGASTRTLDIMGGDRNRLAKFVASPYTDDQIGLDASWEWDLWGRVSASIEAADADISRQVAMLDLARLSLVSDVTRSYLDLRTAQRQIKLAREDIGALEERLRLLEARVKGGVMDHLDLERQRAELASVKGQLPGLLAQEASSANQITLLLGERPGALNALLTPVSGDGEQVLPPDLAMGLPSEVALHRPDIRAAEAQLHRATANIGVAQADLYPSIRLGARFGFESYQQSEFGEWGSRAWSIGPSLNLPLFDRGRRKSVVQLRELEQQEAAIKYQRTVLQAWQEIDDALSAYAAERQQAQQLQVRLESTRQAYELARARYAGGSVDFTTVLDSQRSLLQVRRDLVTTQGRVGQRYVQINRVLGNVPLME